MLLSWWTRCWWCWNGGVPGGGVPGGGGGGVGIRHTNIQTHRFKDTIYSALPSLEIYRLHCISSVVGAGRLYNMLFVFPGDICNNLHHVGYMFQRGKLLQNNLTNHWT